MKKTILITILIFSLVLQVAYAEEAKEVEDSPTTDVATDAGMTEMSMTRGAGDIPDASPGGGISGSVMPFLSESFQTDLATGAATLTIPITIPPGRKNMQPNLALFYSSNNSNDICGVGWAIPVNLIQRSTKKGVPKYDSTDTFMFISSGSNAELVDIGNNGYRAKIESAFMKYVFNPSDNSWLVYDKSGTKYRFGKDSASRLADSNRIFGWYLDRVEDAYGNYITYIYEKPGDGQIYLKEIEYTGFKGDANLGPDKRVEFIYTENRADKMYSYRSGWRIATTRLLSSIYVKLGEDTIWTYELAYEVSPDTGRNLLKSITVKDKNGTPLPPKTFTYQTLD